MKKPINTRTPLFIRYIIVLSIAFICNVLVAAHMYVINVNIAKKETELLKIQKNTQDARISLAAVQSTEYIIKRAKSLGFTNSIEPLYILEGEVAKK